MAIDFPDTPSNGAKYTFNNTTYIYNSNIGAWLVDNQTAYNDSVVNVSTTEPSSPSEGSLWYNSPTFYLRADGAWVNLSSGGGGGGGVTDHGALTGLTDDDHTQYSLADGTRWTTTQTANRVAISNGSGNLVASTTTSTELGHLSGVTSAIQTQLNNKYDNASDVNHNGTTNYVANEHINHTTVSINAGTGLSGGGDISANRTINLDFNNLTTENSVDGAADVISFYDASASAYRKTTIDNLGLGGGGGLSNAYTGMTDGTTLTTASGGDTFKFRTANSLLSISTQSNDPTHGDNILFTLNEGTINHDGLTNFVANEHIDHSSITLTAGEGLSGGGDLTTGRSFALDVNGLTTEASVVGSTDYVVMYDASAGAHRKVLIDNLPGGGGGVTDHGALTGLADDDHTQYSLADGTRWTTTQTANRVPISNGTGNLVVSSVTDTELNYLSGVTSAIQTQLNNKYDADADVNHDNTTGFVADEHVAHSSVTISAGEGLTGGGTIAANRSISLDVNSLTADATPDGAADYVVTYDASASNHKKVLLDDLPGGGGGSTTFTGLTDTPSSYSSQNSKFVRVNSGATALEFADYPSGMPSGSTLPVSPTAGDFFLHTPTGRTWLMQYTGSEWIALAAYGTTTVYVSNDSLGSTNWNDGGTSGAPLKIKFLVDRLPSYRQNNIDINLAGVTFNSTLSALNVPSGLSGGGKIRFIGNTTTVVASTTYSSGSSPYQSWTMSAPVGGGSRGDIIEYVSGTRPRGSSSLGSGIDNWIVKSVSGSTINIAGGIFSSVAPDNTSTFRILSRNTIFDVFDNSEFTSGSSDVEFRYIRFRVPTGALGPFKFDATKNSIFFIGCAFFVQIANEATLTFDSLDGAAIVACYFDGSNQTTTAHPFNFTSGAPSLVSRCLVYGVGSTSIDNFFTCWGGGKTTTVQLFSNYFWLTSGARIGRFYFNCFARFNIAGFVGLMTYVEKANGNICWDVDYASLTQGANAANITKVGFTNNLTTANAARFSLDQGE